ncbi:hypothetical protein EG68_08628 [Paragonimus skrjabini miyazakii]|uniref:DNA-directed RNA polymerase n=1 Tax=Paragonimus skrjabini miyazakii TaxID=59628 RepID=A0A8S9YAT4_9TREM|nr:hypothetical protein EG68_08628 [Paragonimus skrjabini miyazakii]
MKVQHLFKRCFFCKTIIASSSQSVKTRTSSIHEVEHHENKKIVKPSKAFLNAKKITDLDAYLDWVSIKDTNTKAAYLIYEGSSKSVSKSLLSRHARILPSCVSYWKSSFPKWQIALEQDDYLLVSSPSPSVALSQVLNKIYTFNCKMSAFADVSVAAGEFSQFLRLCNTFRRESKMHKGLESGAILLETKIYEALARYFATKADWLSMNGLLKRLEQDGISASPKLYLYAIECLGRLLTVHSVQQTLHFPAVPPPGVGAPLGHFVSHPFLANTNKVERTLVVLLETLVAKAESQGYDLIQELWNLPRQKDTLQHLYAGLVRVWPHLGPDFSFGQRPPVCSVSATNSSCPSEWGVVSYPVEKHLETVKHKMRNAFACAVPDTKELLAAFEQQLSLERRGEVRISPVLPLFPSRVAPGISRAGHNKGAISDELKKRLRQALLAEQNSWRSALLIGFKELLQRLRRSHSRDQITVYPFLKILPAANYVDLMVKAIDNIARDSALQHLNSYLVCMQLGQRVEAACNLYRMEKIGVLDELKHVYTVYAKQFNRTKMVLPQFRHMWQHALQSRLEQGAVSLNQDWTPWTSMLRGMVGRALYGIIYDRLTFDRLRPILVRHRLSEDSTTVESVSQRREQAPVLFEVQAEYDYELRNLVKIHPSLASWYREADYPPLSFHPAELPMLCPPVPWTSLDDAGYLLSRNYATRFMRHSHASSEPALEDDLDFDPASIPSVFDALNCLAACPWRVNEPILDALISVALSGGNRKLSMPETSTFSTPPSVCITKTMTYEERRLAYREAREAQKQYNETRSLWASELYRLSIANQYRDRVFWLPHSLDFRGRVYPCPPHFHHMGSDVARGLIVFARGLKLGERGLDWLRIHLVNLTGLKKRCSNKERLDFANTIIDEALDSARNPFNGRRWWQEQEEPWQTLACCREIAAALDHPSGPVDYVSHFPVHQDGSCNGLQHYAALGRDQRGAESVNLTDKQYPQDVYGDVVEVVEAQRRIDAAAGVPVAQVLEGFVRRKVIKQSVMTTVYGVTLYGASEQIRKQLRELDDFPAREWLGPAGAYLARLTLASIGTIFTSSTDIQAWFGQVCEHHFVCVYCTVCILNLLGWVFSFIHSVYVIPSLINHLVPFPHDNSLFWFRFRLGIAYGSPSSR